MAVAAETAIPVQSEPGDGRPSASEEADGEQEENARIMREWHQEFMDADHRCVEPCAFHERLQAL
eukprot:4282464-Pyramimonas_sp.AAC.1